YTQRLGKCPQVFDGSHGRLELLITETFIRRSQMLHQEPEWNLVGNFKGALDLVHGLDARGPGDRCQVDRRRAGTAPFIVGVERRVDRVEWNAAAAKPVGNLFDVSLAVGIVDMLARGKNLDRLHPAARQSVENAGMQPLFYEQIGGNRSLHVRPLQECGVDSRTKKLQLQAGETAALFIQYPIAF